MNKHFFVTKHRENYQIYDKLLAELNSGLTHIDFKTISENDIGSFKRLINQEISWIIIDVDHYDILTYLPEMVNENIKIVICQSYFIEWQRHNSFELTEIWNQVKNKKGQIIYVENVENPIPYSYIIGGFNCAAYPYEIDKEDPQYYRSIVDKLH